MVFNVGFEAIRCGYTLLLWKNWYDFYMMNLVPSARVIWLWYMIHPVLFARCALLKFRCRLASFGSICANFEAILQISAQSWKFRRHLCKFQCHLVSISAVLEILAWHVCYIYDHVRTYIIALYDTPHSQERICMFAIYDTPCSHERIDKIAMYDARCFLNKVSHIDYYDTSHSHERTNMISIWWNPFYRQGFT